MKSKKKQKRRIPILLERKISLSQLEAEIKKTSDEPYKTRLRTIILFQKGKTKKEIADILVVSRRSVQTWIHIWNQKGREGLKTKPTGRPKGRVKWDDISFQNLAKEIDKSEQYWSIPLMKEWILKNEQKDIPERTVWYRITQIGYSHKSSRPYPYKGDKKKQEIFKKGVSSKY